MMVTATKRAKVERAMATATKRAMAKAERAMAKATNKEAKAARGINMATKWVGWQGLLRWWATNRAMEMATKRAMTIKGDSRDNGQSKEGGGCLMVAMIGTAQRTQPLALRLERGG